MLEITKLPNIEKREESEKKWAREEIAQYTHKKKKMKESMAAKGRATQGWMMKGAVKRLRKMGKDKKIETEVVEERIVTLIVAAVKFSYEIHKKSIKRNRSRRKKEGLELQFTTNSRKNYKAIMNMKTKQDSIGVG